MRRPPAVCPKPSAPRLGISTAIRALGFTASKNWRVACCAAASSVGIGRIPTAEAFIAPRLDRSARSTSVTSHRTGSRVFHQAGFCNDDWDCAQDFFEHASQKGGSYRTIGLGDARSEERA